MPGNSSSAPSGLADLAPSTHGLRRGLHSGAASRLKKRTPYNPKAESIALTDILAGGLSASGILRVNLGSLCVRDCSKYFIMNIRSCGLGLRRLR